MPESGLMGIIGPKHSRCKIDITCSAKYIGNHHSTTLGGHADGRICIMRKVKLMVLGDISGRR